MSIKEVYNKYNNYKSKALQNMKIDNNEQSIEMSVMLSDTLN